MYDRKDLFQHLVAMRGKHGYAESASHIEDVDRSSPPLPSGRWTLGKIRSILEDAVLAGCTQMIARSVRRLKRHGLLRESVDIVIDFHDICRYDKNPDMKFMRHPRHKNGTHPFSTLVSVHCVTEGCRCARGTYSRPTRSPPCWTCAGTTASGCAPSCWTTSSTRPRS